MPAFHLRRGYLVIEPKLADSSRNWVSLSVVAEI